MGTHQDRRIFLRDGSLLLLSGVIASRPSLLLADDAQHRVRIGMIADLHYADKRSAGSRHYRATITKTAEVGEHFQRNKPDFVVELGDLIDAADNGGTIRLTGFRKQAKYEWRTSCDCSWFL
jgi:alkaline phosphatase